MTNEQALKVLEDSTAMLQLNRKDHQIIAQALNVVRAGLMTKDASEKEAGKTPAVEKPKVAKEEKKIAEKTQ